MEITPNRKDIEKIFSDNGFKGFHKYKQDGRAVIIDAKTHEARARVHAAAARLGFESVRFCITMVPRYVGPTFKCKVCGNKEKWDECSKRYVPRVSEIDFYSSQEDIVDTCRKCPHPYVAVPDSVLVWPRGVQPTMRDEHRKRWQRHNRYHAVATALLCMVYMGIPRDIAHLIMKYAGVHVGKVKRAD